MSTPTQAGCGAKHPRMDAVCALHAGDGRHRAMDQWGEIDSWPIGAGEPATWQIPVDTPRATASQGLAVVAVGTLLAAGIAVIAFALVATWLAVS